MNTTKPSVCFVGLDNLPVLADEFRHHGMGGAQLQQTLLARALVRRGFKVSMVVADFGQADGAEWDGITTYKAYRRSSGIPVLRFVHPRWTGVWAALKRADADIYYVSTASELVGETAVFARMYGRKVIYRVASDSDCDPQQLLIRLWRDKKLYEYGLRRADAILAQTEAQRQALIRNYGLSSRVVASMVERTDFVRDYTTRDIHGVWISNLRPLKRPELLLELAAAAPHLKFHMLGGAIAGLEKYFDDIQRQAHDLPNVTFHGAVPPDVVGTYLERARIFINTSEIEGFANTYLQAWVRGTPVVGFHDPDGVITREQLGVTAHNLAALRAAVEVYSCDEEQWREVSGRCRDYMLQTYLDEDAAVRPYSETFEQILRRGLR